MPTAATPGRRPVAARLPGWRREVAFLTGLYVAYVAGRAFVPEAQQDAAFRNARALLNLESAWSLVPEQGLNDALNSLTPLAVLAAYFYALPHYVVTPAVLVWMHRRHPLQYLTARRTLVLASVVGLAVFWLLPVAPPRMLTGGDTLAQTARWGWWGEAASAPRGLGGLTNQLAAMPSLHVGWALWCGILLASYATGWRRWVGAVYPLVMTIDVVATANHYWLDAFGGAALIVVSLGLVGWHPGAQPPMEEPPALTARLRVPQQATCRLERCLR